MACRTARPSRIRVLYLLLPLTNQRPPLANPRQPHANQQPRLASKQPHLRRMHGIRRAMRLGLLVEARQPARRNVLRSILLKRLPVQRLRMKTLRQRGRLPHANTRRAETRIRQRMGSLPAPVKLRIPSKQRIPSRQRVPSKTRSLIQLRNSIQSRSLMRPRTPANAGSQRRRRAPLWPKLYR
jgi:hypothetical protein